LLPKQILPNRVLGNVLVAAAGLSNALGGTLSLRGGPEFLPLSQLLGAGLIFAGFWLAVSGAPQPAAQRARVESGRASRSCGRQLTCLVLILR